jgi:hypothetical protein
MSEQSGPEPGNLDESSDQLQPEETLIDDGVEDVLDRGYSPPDHEPMGWNAGDERFADDHSDSIDERIRQEVADPASAYGAPDNESGLDVERLGGDDPDAIDPEDDWVGDEGTEERRAGRLVAEDEGLGADEDKEAWGRDVGIDGAGASAEEAAVHIVEERD